MKHVAPGWAGITILHARHGRQRGMEIMSRDRVNRMVVEMIRERYSIEDEIGLLRTGPSDEAERYDAYVEECRAWGRGAKIKLGTDA